VESDNHKYTLLLDQQSFRRDKNHRFALDVYVHTGPRTYNGGLQKFSVWEDAVGAFPDGLADVPAQISGNSGLDTVTLHIPEHSDDSPNLTLLKQDKPYVVSMGSSQNVSIDLKNSLTTLHVLTTPEVSITATQCPQCWSKLSGKILRSRLGPGDTTSLVIAFDPNTLELLRRNLLPSSGDTAQEDLTLTAVSRSELGGIDVQQYFQHVSVRFSPPPQFLFLCLLVGAACGIGMRALLARQQQKRFDWLDTVFQFLLAFVVWLFVLLMYATKTRLSVFGYDLDPTALIPAVLITLLAAGGTSVGSKISEVFRT